MQTNVRGSKVEQRKSTLHHLSNHSLINPSLKKANMKKELKLTVMPLIDVVEQIHHSFYFFKKPIVPPL